MKKDMYPYGEEVELEEAFKKGDKVTVNVAKSSDRELQQLSKKFGDTVSGVVIGQTGKIVMVKTDKGIINPFVKDVMKEEVELDEAKSSTGYELYHNSFANAMSHAYTMAKKIHRVDIDRNEIDDKVATGPRKPSVGKTNKYRLKGKGGVMQIQVYNSGNKIKPYELNMYKEEVNPLIEASAAQAARDARRAMRRDPDMRSKGDTADVAATQGDVEKAANHIIMQLRKSVSMNGQKNVEFASGKQKVPAAIAQKVLDMYNKQRTSSDKSKFQMKIAKSYKDLLNAIKGK